MNAARQNRITQNGSDNNGIEQLLQQGRHGGEGEALELLIKERDRQNFYEYEFKRLEEQQQMQTYFSRQEFNNQKNILQIKRKHELESIQVQLSKLRLEQDYNIDKNQDDLDNRSDITQNTIVTRGMYSQPSPQKQKLHYFQEQVQSIEAQKNTRMQPNTENNYLDQYYIQDSCPKQNPNKSYGSLEENPCFNNQHHKTLANQKKRACKAQSINQSSPTKSKIITNVDQYPKKQYSEPLLNLFLNFGKNHQAHFYVIDEQGFKQGPISGQDMLAKAHKSQFSPDTKISGFVNMPQDIGPYAPKNYLFKTYKHYLDKISKNPKYILWNYRDLKDEFEYYKLDQVDEWVAECANSQKKQENEEIKEPIPPKGRGRDFANNSIQDDWYELQEENNEAAQIGSTGHNSQYYNPNTSDELPPGIAQAHQSQNKFDLPPGLQIASEDQLQGKASKGAHAYDCSQAQRPNLQHDYQYSTQSDQRGNQAQKQGQQIEIGAQGGWDQQIERQGTNDLGTDNQQILRGNQQEDHRSQWEYQSIQGSQEGWDKLTDGWGTGKGAGHNDNRQSSQVQQWENKDIKWRQQNKVGGQDKWNKQDQDKAINAKDCGLDKSNSQNGSNSAWGKQNLYWNAIHQSGHDNGWEDQYKQNQEKSLEQSQEGNDRSDVKPQKGRGFRQAQANNDHKKDTNGKTQSTYNQGSVNSDSDRNSMKKERGETYCQDDKFQKLLKTTNEYGSQKSVWDRVDMHSTNQNPTPGQQEQGDKFNFNGWGNIIQDSYQNNDNNTANNTSELVNTLKNDFDTQSSNQQLDESQLQYNTCQMEINPQTSFNQDHMQMSNETQLKQDYANKQQSNDDHAWGQINIMNDPEQERNVDKIQIDGYKFQNTQFVKQCFQPFKQEQNQLVSTKNQRQEQGKQNVDAHTLNEQNGRDYQQKQNSLDQTQVEQLSQSLKDRVSLNLQADQNLPQQAPPVDKQIFATRKGPNPMFNPKNSPQNIKSKNLKKESQDVYRQSNVPNNIEPYNSEQVNIQGGTQMLDDTKQYQNDFKQNNNLPYQNQSIDSSGELSQIKEMVNSFEQLQEIPPGFHKDGNQNEQTNLDKVNILDSTKLSPHANQFENKELQSHLANSSIQKIQGSNLAQASYDNKKQQDQELIKSQLVTENEYMVKDTIKQRLENSIERAKTYGRDPQQTKNQASSKLQDTRFQSFITDLQSTLDQFKESCTNQQQIHSFNEKTGLRKDVNEQKRPKYSDHNNSARIT